MSTIQPVLPVTVRDKWTGAVIAELPRATEVVIEAAVAALVLTFLDRTTFAYGDMVRASTGQCMLHPRLARAVVAACRVEQERVSKGADCLAASWAVLIGVGRGRLLIRALHRASSNSR